MHRCGPRSKLTCGSHFGCNHSVGQHFETLAAIKNPSSVAFVRQANTAHGPQQVNNHIAASRAQETENRQTKLLEVEHGERLDIGATSTAIAAHQELETVAAINGTTNARG
jgi:hypothetical protein